MTAQHTATPCTPPAARDIQGVTRLTTSNMPLPVQKQLQDKILDICITAKRNGRADLSGKEIQERYELVHGKRIDASSVSARVNGLIAAGRLVRLERSRPCRVTGRDIHPVRVVAVQAGLGG